MTMLVQMRFSPEEAARLRALAEPGEKIGATLARLITTTEPAPDTSRRTVRICAMLPLEAVRRLDTLSNQAGGAPHTEIVRRIVNAATDRAARDEAGPKPAHDATLREFHETI